MTGEPYIRKKGNKWIIERKEDGKTIYLMTLPPIPELLKLKRPIKRHGKASDSIRKDIEKNHQKFAQRILTERLDETKSLTPTEEQRKLLWEMSK